MARKKSNKKRILFLATVALLTWALWVAGWPVLVALPVSWLALLGLFQMQVEI